MVNNIDQHFVCSRLTFHNLVNRYNITGSVRDRARPGRACATTLQAYRSITLTHLRSPFYQQPLLRSVYGVHAQTIINRFLQNNGPGIFQHDNARTHITSITTQFLAQNNVNVFIILLIVNVFISGHEPHRMNWVRGPGPIIILIRQMTPICTSVRVENVFLTCLYKVT